MLSVPEDHRDDPVAQEIAAAVFAMSARASSSGARART
jgi:hypothetical protein